MRLSLPSIVRSRRLTLLGLALVALLAIGAGSGQAADPFVAGGRSTRPVTAQADQLARAETRGRALATALGIAGASQRVIRLEDKFEHRTYDEVTSFDGHGREVAITRFDLDGTVAMAVALGWQPKGGPAIDAVGAEGSAAALARAAGLGVAGRPDVRVSAGAGGWSVSWQRRVAGVPVRGDGVRVLLWPDGSFHGLARSERALAPLPGRTITVNDARRSALTFAVEHFGVAAPQARIVAVERAWVAPNDTFRPAAPDAPAETLRLAWIVRFETRGALAERLRAVELWLDAGDGTQLGGDLVE